MSTVNWTPEQKQAIESRGHNLLVSAAAGSGKTALLTERLKELVLRGELDTSRVLMLTFTRAAAAEMRERFKNKLYDALTQPAGTYKLSEKEILAQISALTDAHISTIHGFAAAMARRYFEAADVDPDFRVGNEAELALMLNEVMDAEFEALFEAAEAGTDDFAPAFTALAELYGGSRTNERLKDELKALLNFLESIAHPKTWMREKIAALRTGWDNPAYAPLTQTVRHDLRQSYEDYRTAEPLFEALPWDKSLKTYKGLRAEFDAALGLKDVVESGDLKALVEAAAAVPFGRLVVPKNTPQHEKDRLKALRDPAKVRIKKSLKDLSAQAIAEEADANAEMADVMENLWTLARRVEARYAAAKRAAHVMSYSDLERALLRILEDEKTRADLSGAFDMIFLDEYQDTNPVQDAIISSIERGGNCFMVGDLKQSIYRFRSADPGIFIDKYHNYRVTAAGELILLNKNFRSTPEVIGGVNAVFEKIMSEPLGEMAYDDDARLSASRQDHGALPELTVLDHVSTKEADEAQARFIASKIKALQREYEAKGKPLELGDIGILYRSFGKRAKTIVRVLTEEGIPVIYEGDSEYFEAEEVRVFLHLIALIDNHKQDLPLLAMMSQPVFGFSLDDFAAIRAALPDADYFYEAAESYRDEKDDALADRLKAFYARLETWRAQSHHMDIDAFLWMLLLDSGYYYYCAGFEDGKTRRRNLRILLERAREYKNTALKGLTSFLDYVGRLKKNSQSLPGGGISPLGKNAVHLMTVHKSKGLEFPVVFVGDLARNFQNVQRGNIMLHAQAGIAPKWRYFEDDALISRTTLLQNAFQTLADAQEKSEELRLLYVAMTRARERLYMVGAVENAEEAQEHWQSTDPYALLEAKSTLDWVMSALSPDMLTDHDTDTWQIRFASADATEPETQETQTEDPEAYETMRKELFKQLEKSFEPKRKTLPVKRSVTQLKESAAQKQVVLNAPGSGVKGSLSAAEIGSAVHEFLQNVDLSAYVRADDTQAELERQKDDLLSAKRLTPEKHAVIDTDIVADFFESPLGARMLVAYKKSPDNVLRETAFTCEMGKDEESGRPLEVQGVIDCCFLENGSWVLVDYKTDRFYTEALWEARRAGYTAQLGYYAAALEKLTKTPVGERHIYFLNEREDYEPVTA